VTGIARLSAISCRLSAIRKTGVGVGIGIGFGFCYLVFRPDSDTDPDFLRRRENEQGVLLFNLGGPENLQDVRPFLYNLFSDPEIIRIKNSVLRKMLAWLIASTRQSKSRDLYRQIGGGSPLRKITEAQATALRDELRARSEDAGVYVGMRCWKPTIDEAVNQILKDGITRLVLLPLFPHTL